MKNLMTIFHREFSVYFQSMIGYIFIIVFLLFGVGLFVTPFFTFPVADMRNFFNMIPLILCIFVPAITMRLWADERKENTFELLMTFPMKSYEVVLGKYFSALAFFAVALACTFIVPVMLVSLGNPDLGQIATSYLGAFLLGSMLLAVGIFVSGFCKEQIIAFVSALMLNVTMFLAGTDFIQAYIDGVLPGVGRFLGVMLGFSIHFQTFTRGIIETVDVVYFISWTGIFLFLNGFLLEIRNKGNLRSAYSASLGMALAIGFLLNWVVADLSLGRLDMTEGKIYTVSDATKTVLSKLNVPVNIKLYITPRAKMPTELKSLEDEVTSKIEEMRIASHGHINFNVIYLEASNVIGRDPAANEDKSDEESAIEKRMLDKGVKPFSARAIREDSVINVLVYSAIGIAFKDKKEEIIPQVVPQNLHELEYLIVSSTYKLTRDKMPVIALVAPKEAVKISPMMKQIYQQMGRPLPQSEDPYIYLEQILQREKYDVKRVELSESSPLPDTFDTLVVINPRELHNRERFEINKALVEGKNVFMAVQKVNWNYRVQNRAVAINPQEEKPNIDSLLKFYGVSIADDILMDENHQPLTIQDPSNPFGAMMGGGLTLDLPIQIVLNQESMNPDVSITSRLSGMFYLWGAGVDVDDAQLKKHQLEKTVLMSTSKNGWTIPKTQKLEQKNFDVPATGKRSIPVAVMVKGQFPNFFEGKKLPKWIKEDPSGGPAVEGEEGDAAFADYKKASGQMILVGGTQMFRKNFLQRSNLDFFLNSIDALSLGEELIRIRSKKQINRMIPKPSPSVKAFWKFTNYLLINALVAIIGLTIFIRRKKSREAYTLAHN